MCGIIGYIGSRDACPIILKGLKRLEYRGYDSAGIALLDNGLSVFKKKGKVSVLEAELAGKTLLAGTGIGHTRWATHGEPSDRNAHPFLSAGGKLAMVHNGIIENHALMKKILLEKGYVFQSDTDTEVLLNFIEDKQLHEGRNLEDAVRLACECVKGTYAILLLDGSSPGRMIAIRRGSPLVIGVGNGEYFVSSDISALSEYTSEVIFFKDDELAIITAKDVILKNLLNEQITPQIETLNMRSESVEKGGFAYFMLKEIAEQADTLQACLSGRLSPERRSIVLPGFQQHLRRFAEAPRIVILGCGTSWHAGLVAEYIFEELCRIPVEVEYASEFRYRNPVVHPGDIVIALSQSGETADTIVAIELARKQGAFVVGIVNTPGSTIARMADCRAYLHAGAEIGVASTKAFTAQLAVLTMAALVIGRARGTVEPTRFRRLVCELEAVPVKVRKILTQDGRIRQLAAIYKDARNMLYLGRGAQFPVALEGALKVKEISYIHAEGYPAAEMKHGPIALIDDQLPVVCIALQDESYSKMTSNIQEVIARKGKVIAIITEGEEALVSIADNCIEIPSSDPLVAPILSAIPLQLLAYHMGVARGCDVDMPRNLAKSVTVE